MHRAEPTAGPYLDVALPFYADKDVAHGPEHIHRLRDRVLLLVPPAADVNYPYLWFLVAFHGLVPLMDTADFRSNTVAQLERLGWPAVDAHDALVGLERHTTAPTRLEEELVHDANLLEVIGAFGVAKAFTRGGADGQTYEETLAIFERNLEAAHFVTDAGRLHAEAGRAYAQAFVRQLHTELQPSTLPTFPPCD